ncbi:unnamed protein product, partial [Adineta ricciae]
MFYTYRDSVGNIVTAAFVQALRRAEQRRMSQNQPAITNHISSSSDFVPVDARDAFDARRFPIVAAFDAAYYPGACVQRYCAAAVASPASASCYPLLGPRREPEILLPQSHPA